MKALLFLISTRFLKLVKHFSHGDRASERKFFGFGQFVLLLTLAPFIFNLTLYSFGNIDKVASHYEYNPNRFSALPALANKLPPPAFSDYTTQLPVLKSLPKKELKALTFCNRWKIGTKRCKALRKKQQGYAVAFANAMKQYMAGYRKYLADNKKYQVVQAKYKKDIEAKYHAFQPDTAKPSPLPPITIKQHANRSYIGLLTDGAEKGSWQQISFPIWLLGALLIFPTIALCIRRQQWGLLAFGLAIPAFNYLLTIPIVFFDWDTLINWKMSSTLVPQIAFFWFALRGQIRSKSFVYFLFFMFACTFLPTLTSDSESFSSIKAQLPILVFIIVAAIARLIAKGARENAYLLKNLGWLKGLKTGLHALLLWLPMAALAIPFLYLTEVIIPKAWINHLHNKQVLVFDHTHDILDNALQSTALKTDDVIYAWHMKTQTIKKDIFDKKTKLTSTDLEQSFKEKFDEVVPKDLEFEDSDSGVPFVGFIVDLSVDASQKSTNKAFSIFRNSIKASLTDTVADNERNLKDTVEGNVAKAFKLIDKKHAQGRAAILTANQTTQTSLWWSINTMRALHQLTLLFFAFICIKSFMYVFARVSFNRNTGTFVSLGETKKAIADDIPSPIKPTGREYLINGDINENYYISRRFQCRGKAPKFTIPQPLYAPIARLFNGAYTMNKIVMHSGDDQISCSATKGMEFFEWSLAEGETVILDFHYFVGMSESIKVSTLISPRMSSLLLGKMIFSQATGPGKLILMAKGRAEIINGQEATGSLPPERLIAMNKNTRLHIDSELDPINIYLSTAYIRPAGGGKVIVDVDSQRGSKAGLASFIKHFILPW
jgi:uncharacterized protein (AIM24 family)